MDLAYKLQIKIGESEFNAEGPEATVRDAYEKFISAVTGLMPVRERRAEPSRIHDGPNSETSPPPASLIQRVFQNDKEVVSLRLLPPDSTHRIADAVLLILYGFRVLQSLQDVPVTKLLAALRQSGISVDRLDRVIGAHSSLVIKGGSQKGGRYALNNQGVARAESLLVASFN